MAAGGGSCCRCGRRSLSSASVICSHSLVPTVIFHEAGQILWTTLSKLLKFPLPPLCSFAFAVRVCLTTLALSRLVSLRLFNLISLKPFSAELWRAGAGL